jgi:hypothetical protein
MKKLSGSLALAAMIVAFAPRAAHAQGVPIKGMVTAAAAVTPNPGNVVFWGGTPLDLAVEAHGAGYSTLGALSLSLQKTIGATREALPSELLKRVSIDVSLRPGGTVQVQVPLWATGSIVMARLQTPALPTTPRAKTPSKRTKPVTSSEIGDLLARQVARQEHPATTFSLSVDGKILPPIRRLSGANHFVVKVAEPAKVGSGTLKNVSSQPLKGRLLIGSIDAAGYTRLKQAQQEKDIADAVRSHRNPDLLLIVNHTLKRQLQAFPGGASPYERRAAAALARVSPTAIRRITERLTRMEPSLAQRVRDKTLTKLSIQQAVPPAAVASAAVTVDQSVLVPGAEDVKRDEDPDPSILLPPQASAAVDRPPVAVQRYNIRLFGVESLYCANDVGWEYGCDAEEPYVVWATFGPGYARYGRTEDASDVTKGDDFFYTQQTNVLSTDPAKPDPIRPPLPLLFLYQVVEADPDGPTRDEVVEVLKGGLSAAISAYKEDWKSAVANGAPALVDTFVLMMNIAGAGDDRYAVKAAAFDAPRLLDVTSGNSPGPLDEDVFTSEGDYDKLSIRVPVFKKGGEKRFSVVYFIIRE